MPQRVQVTLPTREWCAKHASCHPTSITPVAPCLCKLRRLCGACELSSSVFLADARQSRIVMVNVNLDLTNSGLGRQPRLRFALLSVGAVRKARWTVSGRRSLIARPQSSRQSIRRRVSKSCSRHSQFKKPRSRRAQARLALGRVQGGNVLASRM